MLNELVAAKMTVHPAPHPLSYSCLLLSHSTKAGCSDNNGRPITHSFNTVTLEAKAATDTTAVTQGFYHKLQLTLK